MSVIQAPLRVGVHIDSNHMAFGGPSTLILNTIIGLKKLGHEVVLNGTGDINWFISLTPIKKYLDTYGILPANSVAGPCIFNEVDHISKEHVALIQQTKRIKFIFAGQWFHDWITRGSLDFTNFKTMVWPGGVDTEYYSPGPLTKNYDYFIYFKNRNILELKAIQSFLFLSCINYP
jgi:hypothetical protein